MATDRIPLYAGARVGLWMLLFEERIPDSRGARQRFWKCRCACDRERFVGAKELHAGKSSGCLRCRAGSRTHGLRDRPEYSVWRGMRRRCEDPRVPGYKNYGARGITTCDRWNNFALFLSDMGSRPSLAHTLERIDNNAGYKPGNVKWATMREQSRNRRSNRFLTYQNETLIIADWATKGNMSTAKLWDRLSRGWTIPQALSLEPRPPSRHKKGL